MCRNIFEAGYLMISNDIGRFTQKGQQNIDKIKILLAVKQYIFFNFHILGSDQVILFAQESRHYGVKTKL